MSTSTTPTAAPVTAPGTAPDTAPDTASMFSTLVHSRSSARAFLPTPLPSQDIRAVLEDAQRAPSNSNTQPWVVHMVSGATRDTLAGQLLAAFDRGESSPDFTGDYGQGLYLQRSHEHAAAHYQAQGVAREDREGRGNVMRENLDFYGAPHVALLFTPVLGDGVRAGSDVGMYAQTFLLALTARGYQAVPQAVLGSYADTVREVLGVPADLKLLYGIAFGLADESATVNDLRMSRVPLTDSIIAHDTPGVLD